MSLRQILHIEAGGPDWNPSAEDLSRLTAMFQEAVASPDGAVITTRSGVVARIVEVSEGAEVRVVRAMVDLPIVDLMKKD